MGSLTEAQAAIARQQHPMAARACRERAADIGTRQLL